MRSLFDELPGSERFQLELAHARHTEAHPEDRSDDPGVFHERRVLIAEPFFKTDRLMKRDRRVLGRALNSTNLMRLIELEIAANTDADRIRSLCRHVVDAWLPVVEEMDFRPRVFEPVGWETPSSAAELLKLFEGKVVEKKNGLVKVRRTAIPQPFRSEMNDVFICAALCRDQKLAKELAAKYKLYEPRQLTAQFEKRDAMLRHLLADDEKQAREVSKMLRPGYPADWPPQRIELPLGIISQKRETILHGAEAINTRFSGLWSESRARRRYDQSCKQSRRRSTSSSGPSWEEFRSLLLRNLACSWLVSFWALAFLNIAAWKRQINASTDTSGFSPWIPARLVEQ